jgi:hypothetical protein
MTSRRSNPNKTPNHQKSHKEKKKKSKGKIIRFNKDIALISEFTVFAYTRNNGTFMV